MTDTIKGSLWMVGGVFCLTSMAVAGKEISLQIDTFEILFYRSVIGVSIIPQALTTNAQRRYGW